MDTERVMDHFEHPRNVGEVESPDATARAENPVCGDLVRVSMSIADGRVVDMRFRAFGCHSVIAAMSLLSERVRGESLADVLAIAPARIEEWFEDFPAGKSHAAELAVEVVRRALVSVR